MNRQRGQIALYGALAVGLILMVMGVALKVQTSRLDALRTEYEGFKAQVKANGEAAEKAKALKEAHDKQEKEKSDNEYKKLLANNASLASQLRNNRATGGILPRPSPSAPSSVAACFDRTLLESALQRLDAGVSSLIAEGDTLGIRLKLSQEWALSVK